MTQSLPYICTFFMGGKSLEQLSEPFVDLYHMFISGEVAAGIVSVPDPNSHVEVYGSGALAYINCLWDMLTYTGSRLIIEGID